MKMYRAVLPEHLDENKVYQALTTRRAPSNVPFLIDNIWEFLRPNHLPSRRHAIYASPTPELALANASSGEANAIYVACELIFNLDNSHHALKVAQLNVTDARYHTDIRNLQKLVMNRLACNDLSLEAKKMFAVLFLPCVSREELEKECKENELLKEILHECQKKSTFWQDASDTPDIQSNGELFFELMDNQSYQLKKQN
jgi:hypothetical protein